MKKKTPEKKAIVPTAEQVEKAIASFKQIKEVEDGSEAYKKLAPDVGKLARKQENLAFRAKVLEKIDPTEKGDLTVAQKEALKAAAVIGTVSLHDFAFCARITLIKLKRFLRKNKDFERQLAFLANTPSLSAKRNIISAIEDGDIPLSQWWLERHQNSEFNQNSSGKKDDSPLVIVLAKGEEPKPVTEEAEIIREELDANDSSEPLRLADDSMD